MMKILQVVLIIICLLSIAGDSFSQLEPDIVPLPDGLTGKIDVYEKDATVEKHDLYINVELRWGDDAKYTENDPANYCLTTWSVQDQVSARVATRIYCTHPLMATSVIAVAPIKFQVATRDLSVVYQVQSRSNNMISDGVKVDAPAFSTVYCRNPQFNIGKTFSLDFTVNGGILYPTIGGIPVSVFMPFMTPLHPDTAMNRSAQPTQSQLLANPALMSKFGIFKVPITLDDISFDELKQKKVITRYISLKDSGRGIRGMGQGTIGAEICSISGAITISLVSGEGYSKPPEDKKDQQKDAGKDAKKEPSPSDNKAKDVRAKGGIIFGGIIAAPADGFTGNDYIKLSKRDRQKLITDFIDAAKRSGVTIRNLPVFYCRKVDDLYGRKPNLLPKPLVDVLMMHIVMAYDWSEPDIDPDSLARAYLGAQAYSANRSRDNL